jgi:coenzyme F420-reducing hydrogenase gamma subunit
MPEPPTLAVWKFASCDGCQLSILDCEDELLALADVVRIAHFPEASRASIDGPYDVSLVEGSVTTPDDIERIHRIREQSGVLVAIGACATAGGIQALRNAVGAERLASLVYPRPDYLSVLSTSTPASVHVTVDLELHGCPIDRRQLIDTVAALLAGRRPDLPGHSVCFECKTRDTVCVLVAHDTPCLGPVTRAGCGAVCPAYGRGCFGCFGPAVVVNTPSLVTRLRELGLAEVDLDRLRRTFYCARQERAGGEPRDVTAHANATAFAAVRGSDDPPQ